MQLTISLKATVSLSS